MTREKKNFRVTTKMPPLPEIEDSPLSLFDPESNDLNLFNLVDEENIRLSGSKLFYYKYVGVDEFDSVYMESREKPILRDPIKVTGHYTPTPIEENLEEFGIQIENDQIFIFNLSYIERALGRRPISGDIVKPAFQNQKYEIFEVQEDSFEVYGVYHLNCFSRLLRDSDITLDTTLLDTSDDDLNGYSRNNI